MVNSHTCIQEIIKELGRLNEKMFIVAYEQNLN